MSKKRKIHEPLSTLDDVRKITEGEDVVIVDPGSDGTGWCLWPFYPNLQGCTQNKPLSWGVLRSKKQSWQGRMEDIVKQLHADVMDVIPPERMLLEWPELWGGSARSQASAISGDLIKLSALCGALEVVAIQYCPQASLFISANQWKGQLTKPAVNARIKRAIGEAYPNHVSDTVGMGLAVMGLL